MVRLAVIADDLTGALDTGAAFAGQGIRTQVNIGGYDFLCADEIQVAVIDTETRHAAPAEAYRAVFKAARQASQAKVAYLYKKTDSTLRGCVGSELAAALDGFGRDGVCFLPAFPQQRRTTQNGTQYVDGIPVHQSAFGKDPFTPVPHSYIPRLISPYTNARVRLVPKGEYGAPFAAGEEKTISVYDAETEDDLRAAGQAIKKSGRLWVTAGCAGFARELPGLIGFGRAEYGGEYRAEGLTVICGSLNPASKRHILHACRAGFCAVHLTPRQKLEPGYLESDGGHLFLARLSLLAKEHGRIIIDTFSDSGFDETAAYADAAGISPEDTRRQIALRLGGIAKEIARLTPKRALLICGGDTLFGFMRQINRTALEPVKELYSGVILARLWQDGREVKIITKAGGFGDENIYTRIAQDILI